MFELVHLSPGQLLHITMTLQQRKMLFSADAKCTKMHREAIRIKQHVDENAHISTLSTCVIPERWRRVDAR